MPVLFNPSVHSLDYTRLCLNRNAAPGHMIMQSWEATHNTDSFNLASSSCSQEYAKLIRSRIHISYSFYVIFPLLVLNPCKRTYLRSIRPQSWGLHTWFGTACSSGRISGTFDIPLLFWHSSFSPSWSILFLSCPNPRPLSSISCWKKSLSPSPQFVFSENCSTHVTLLDTPKLYDSLYFWLIMFPLWLQLKLLFDEFMGAGSFRILFPCHLEIPSYLKISLSFTAFLWCLPFPYWVR